MRVYTKIGDIFSVKIDENTKKYFHLIAFDLTQLNSDVIRAFKKRYPVDDNPTISEIIQDKIDFYAHCVTKAGVKLGYWEKIGSIKEIGTLNHILFMNTNDYGCKVGEDPVKISDKWYVWNINGEFRDVGKLVGENRKAYIGIVINLLAIQHNAR